MGVYGRRKPRKKILSSLNIWCAMPRISQEMSLKFRFIPFSLICLLCTSINFSVTSQKYFVVVWKASDLVSFDVSSFSFASEFPEPWCTNRHIQRTKIYIKTTCELKQNTVSTQNAHVSLSMFHFLSDFLDRLRCCKQKHKRKNTHGTKRKAKKRNLGPFSVPMPNHQTSQSTILTATAAANKRPVVSCYLASSWMLLCIYNNIYSLDVQGFHSKKKCNKPYIGYYTSTRVTFFTVKCNTYIVAFYDVWNAFATLYVCTCLIYNKCIMFDVGRLLVSSNCIVQWLMYLSID